MEPKNNEVVETVECDACVYETPEGNKTYVTPPKPKRKDRVKEEKPKGRVRNWVAGKLHSAGEFLSDDEKVHSLTKKVKRGAIVAGVGALAVGGLAMSSGKSDKKELPYRDDEVSENNYLTESDYECEYETDDNYDTSSVEETVEETE